MKIENINDDIIKDTIDLRNEVEQKIIDEKPQLDFTLSLPGLEEMSAIKLIELSIHENEETHGIRAEIHTHNGHRIFENNFRQLQHTNTAKPRHPLHGWFFTLLREVIKKRKVRLSRTKSLHFRTV